MTPFRTDEEQALLDAPGFEILERTKRMVKSRTVTPSTIELHDHALESPMRWTRRSVIHEKHGGVVLARIVATEEIVAAASGGCVFRLDKEVTPLDRRMTRQFGPGLRMAIATDREAYAQQARRLARRLREAAHEGTEHVMSRIGPRGSSVRNPDTTA